MSNHHRMTSGMRSVSSRLLQIANDMSWAGPNASAMADYRTQAEAQITILARALGLGPAELELLGPVDPEGEEA